MARNLDGIEIKLTELVQLKEQVSCCSVAMDTSGFRGTIVDRWTTLATVICLLGKFVSLKILLMMSHRGFRTRTNRNSFLMAKFNFELEMRQKLVSQTQLRISNSGR